MIRNYLLVAWRSLKKHKTFTLINLIGLSLSMSVCLLLILLVLDHMGYDEFHPKKDSIYRILTFPNDGNPIFNGYASSPQVFRSVLDGQHTAVSEITQLNRDFKGEIRSPYKILEADGFFADEHFFSVFGFTLQEGDPETCLVQPFSILLSADYAEKLFPGESPLGKLVEFKQHGSYQVTGVVAPPSGKSHIRFDVLGSHSTLPALKAKKLTYDYDGWENSWESIWINHTYLVLNSPDSREAVKDYLNQKAGENMQIKEGETGYHFELQALDDITPGRILSNELAFTFPSIILAFFLILGLIVILTASINYTNLSVAKSLSRAREVGIRKVNGAQKGQIVAQFLVESVVLAMLSLGLAVILYRFLVHEFNSLWIISAIKINIEETPLAYLFFFMFTLFLGTLTGIGPALYLAKFDLISALKGRLGGSRSRRRRFSFNPKKILLGIQFSLAIFMIMTIFILKDQANYMTTAHSGFEKENVFFVDLQGHSPEVLRSEFESYHGILETAMTSHHPAVGRSYGGELRLAKSDEPIETLFFYVDEGYVPLMGLSLVAGGNFPENRSHEHESVTIVNEQAAIRLGFDSPADIVGESILIDDSLKLTVAGVVADYHFEPIMIAIEPLLLRYKPENFQYLYMKVSPENPKQTRENLQAIWTRFDPKREFKAGFLDEEMTLFYQFLYDISDILMLIALLAIVITSLGLLGMVSFTMKTKVKEIGIRKVLGAGHRQLLWLLSKEFGWVLMISLVIGAPLALVVNSLWVNLMANRAGITPFNTLPGILIVVAISVVVIVSQTWKSANSNPAESLRSE